MPSSPTLWSAQVESFPLAWDSTMLTAFKACPRRFYYAHILGMRTRSESAHLTFGRLYASGVETYAKARAEGAPHQDAARIMVRATLARAGEEEVDQNTGEVTFRVWRNEDDRTSGTKNRYTLLRSLVWRVEWAKDRPLKTVRLADGAAAVELSFRFHAFDLGGEPILLCGHLDEVADEKDTSERWVSDDKTTSKSLDDSYFSQYSPNVQVSLYSLAAPIVLSERGLDGTPRRIAGVRITAAQIAKGFTRFASRAIPRPQSVLAEWLEDTQSDIERARGYASRGHWPQNDSACFLCTFKKVCAQAPSFREAWLRADFEERRWNPLESR